MKSLLTNLFLKIGCIHKWTSFRKVTHKWVNTEMVEGTGETPWNGEFIKPKFYTVPMQAITEVLICEHCSKLKNIEY